jgi:hypothetical protein
LAVVGAATSAFENGLKLPEVDRRLVLQWFRQARGRLSFEACVSNLDLRDFACTLLVAVVGDEGAVFAQLGDGAIVVNDGDSYQPVFWPQSGEYANTTNFITGADAEDCMEFQVVGRAIEDLAMFTDGLQPLALHYASRTAHSPFFAPMFESLSSTESTETLASPLSDFLNSDAVNKRTDDDKTLVLATRRSSAHAIS